MSWLALHIMHLLRYILALLLIAFINPVAGQSVGALIGIDRSVRPNFEPRGPGILYGPLDPAIKKWHIPYELSTEYGWQEWAYTNYARQQYQRYVATSRQGNIFYDVFGNTTPRTWVVYDWRQSQPQKLGNIISEGSAPSSWFNAVTLSGDTKGSNSYNITIGSNVRTTLTPLTFSKPSFTGIQLDYLGNRLATTILASRISNTSRSPQSGGGLTNMTHLIGGRATYRLGESIVLGANLVNSRQAITTLGAFKGDPIAGSLTSAQTKNDLSAIAVVLSDDSPEDGIGGATLFAHELRIISRNFQTGKEQIFTLDQVIEPGKEWPIVVGGSHYRDFLSADGEEQIILNYVFTDPAYNGPAPNEIVSIEFSFVLGNDYRVEVWSDLQTGRYKDIVAPLIPEDLNQNHPVLFTVQQAEGNIQDLSNLQWVRFDYGLPTANQIAGVTLEGSNVLGFDFYGEWDHNWRYFQHPNSEIYFLGKKHHTFARQADARIFHASKEIYPWFFFVEGYAIDAAYSTTAFLSRNDGNIQYDNTQLNLYEFVDDNDDHDRLPDWSRYKQGSSDRSIFPGWDENNDFVSDFNQNDNGVTGNPAPDYEEPFLRYLVERPEFLFGIDLNNNFWIDRFEDDDLPDYPYKPDRHGYNFFGGYRFTPTTRLLGGRVAEHKPTNGLENKTAYLMFALDLDHMHWGRLRIFQMLKRAEDNIPDDRRAPSPFAGSPRQPLVRDMVTAPNTWINTSWLGWDAYIGSRISTSHLFKWNWVHQNGQNPRSAENKRLRRDGSFLGLVNKAAYAHKIGWVTFETRLKSEWLRQVPHLTEQNRQHEWQRFFQILVRLPLLNNTNVQGGLEQWWLNELNLDEEEQIKQGHIGGTGDQRSTHLAIQLNLVEPDYMGYKVTTQIGLLFKDIAQENIIEKKPAHFVRDQLTSREMTTFITVYASIR